MNKKNIQKKSRNEAIKKENTDLKEKSNKGNQSGKYRKRTNGQNI